jgi:hypothetical protein
MSPSYMSPNLGEGGVAGFQLMSTAYTGAQINFGDLTPYLTYAYYTAGPTAFLTLAEFLTSLK